MSSNRRFGSRKKKPRGIQVALQRKEQLKCSLCDELLDGCPTSYTADNVKSFLLKYDQFHPCLQRHCSKCKCSNCFGSDTQSADSQCDSSTEPYLDSSFEKETQGGISLDPDYSQSEHSTDESCIDPAFVDKKQINTNEFRIINLGELSKHVTLITLHAATCVAAQELSSDGNAPIQLLGETKRDGLSSFFHSVCLGCGKRFSWWTSSSFQNESGKSFEVNVRAVWSQMSTGGGHAKSCEETSTLAMPSLSSKKYIKLENEIGKWWKEILQQEMLNAGIEERKFAEKNGNFHESIPYITVVIDAGWSKTAHKHTYNAPGGVGIVVGLKTKKLLFIGVRVKTCLICSRAEGTDMEPESHQCGKNWSDSSQAMEADIFLEAFSQCEAIHGVRYLHIIGDGDSNTLAKLQSCGPSWCRNIEKVECANHACKCLRSSLEKLVEDNPTYKGKDKLTKARRVKLTTGVRCAIKMRSNEVDTIGKEEAVNKLKQDLLNAVWHVFGHHGKCSADFCKSKQSQGTETKEPENSNTFGEENRDEQNGTDVFLENAEVWHSVTSLDEMEKSRYGDSNISKLEGQLLHDVSIIVSRLVNKADKLIMNQTSNLAENWMSIRSKFDGGKKINRCHRFSWYYRCYGAGLRRNLGATWSAAAWEACTGTPASTHLWKFGQNQAKEQQATSKVKERPRVKLRAKRRSLKRQQQASSLKAQKAYGPQAEELAVQDDVSPNQLKDMCSAYYEDHVVVTPAQVREIEKSTHLQAASGLWKDHRKRRLTASVFGSVVKRNPNIKVTPLVLRLLHNTFRGTACTRYGLQQENATIKDYEAVKTKETGKNVHVERCGLFIDPINHHLGATPDGIVVLDGTRSGLLEIKNVLRNKTVTFEEEAKKSKTSFCLELVDGTLKLKRKHDYYYQCQGQINICNFQWVDFVVRSTNPYQIHIERIEKDSEMWNKEMLPKLSAFYHQAVLPELASPRKGKIPGIREPGNWYEDPSSKTKAQSAKRKLSKRDKT